MKKKIGIVIAILFVLAALGGGIWYFQEQTTPPLGDQKLSPFPLPNVQLKIIKIVNVHSKSRPIAVMINNLTPARKNHAGLGDAYLVYEMIAEGGLTRLMAVFKDQTTERIGSVRSSRHYYLDYALENDAIYVHYGWSPQAESDIASLKINNINGLYDDAFWRDLSLNVAYEHTAFTSIEKITTVAQQKKYRMTSDQPLLLNYSFDPVGLEEKENKMVANQIRLPYSNYVETTYQYDPDQKLYLRSVNGEPHVDAITKKQYTAKNIIVANVENYSIDSYGRQALKNIGSGDGYFISEGYAVPIRWSKASRSAQTVYTYLDGTEIMANDGNTYIQIVPLHTKIAIQ